MDVLESRRNWHRHVAVALTAFGRASRLATCCRTPKPWGRARNSRWRATCATKLRYTPLAIVSVCAVSLMLAGCLPDLPARAPRDTSEIGGASTQAPETATSTIGPKGGRIELASSDPSHPEARVVLDVPKGAFSSPVGLTMSLVAAEKSTVGDGSEIAGRLVRIEPGGLELLRPATLSLPSPPADQSALHVTVLYRESAEAAWTPIPTFVVDEAKGTVSAALWHFSEFRAAFLASDDAFDTAFDPERDGFGFADIGHHIGHPKDCPDGASIAFAAYASWFFEHKPDVGLKGRYCSSCFDPRSLTRSEVVERSRLLCEDGLALTCQLFLRFYASWVSIFRGFEALDQAEDGDWQQYWSIRNAMFRTARPQLLLLGMSGDACNNDTCRHSVLATGYTARSIRIYDPSYPEETRELAFGPSGMEEYDGRYVKLFHLDDCQIFKVIEEMGLFEAFEPKMCSPESCDGCDNNCDGDVDEGDTCVEPAFENPQDSETEDVQITITQIETTGGSREIKLFAKVETERGRPLQRLTAGNFVLRETIEGISSVVPVDSVYTAESSSEGMSAGLLIDSSGSMGKSTDPGSPLSQAKAGAKLFVDKLKPEDAAAVLNFGSTVETQCEFTNDRQTLLAAIDAFPDGGNTAMYDALLEGIDMAIPRSGQRALVLLSDGGDNSSECTPCRPSEVVPALKA